MYSWFHDRSKRRDRLNTIDYDITIFFFFFLRINTARGLWSRSLRGSFIVSAKLRPRSSDVSLRRRYLCFLSALVGRFHGSSTRTFACHRYFRSIPLSPLFLHVWASSLSLSLSFSSSLSSFCLLLRLFPPLERLHSRRCEPQLMRPHGSKSLSA